MCLLNKFLFIGYSANFFITTNIWTMFRTIVKKSKLKNISKPTENRQKPPNRKLYLLVYSVRSSYRKFHLTSN